MTRVRLNAFREGRVCCVLLPLPLLLLLLLPLLLLLLFPLRYCPFLLPLCVFGFRACSRWNLGHAAPTDLFWPGVSQCCSCPTLLRFRTQRKTCALCCGPQKAHFVSFTVSCRRCSAFGRVAPTRPTPPRPDRARDPLRGGSHGNSTSPQCSRSTVRQKC